MFKLKRTLAACVALAMIGGIIALRRGRLRRACTKEPPRQENAAAVSAVIPSPAAPVSVKSRGSPPDNPGGPGHTTATAAQACAQPANGPNILFIMGDDVGWFNIGAYHRGIMSGKTPHLDASPARA